MLCPQAQEGKVPLGPQQGGSPWNSNTRSVQEWSECYLGRTPTNVYLTRANDPFYEPMSDRLFEISFGGGSQDPLTGGPPQRHQWLENFVLSRYEGQQRVYSLKPLKSPDMRGANVYLGTKPLKNFTPNEHIQIGLSVLQMVILHTCKTRLLVQTKPKPNGVRSLRKTRKNARSCSKLSRYPDGEFWSVKCSNSDSISFGLQAHRIRPELQCDAPVKNTFQCIDKIYRNQSDIALIDIGDLATASRYCG